MEEANTAAIRMVAFGVLEAKPAPHVLFETHVADDEVLRAVRVEVEALGWFLALETRHRGQQFVLLGPLGGSPRFSTRPKIGHGTLQQVCEAAVRYLDYGPSPEPTPTPE